MREVFFECKDCKPNIMDREGCCTNNVGKGTKFLISYPSGIRLLVCALLTKFDDGSWGCGDYLSRPEICKSFDCHRVIYKE